MRLPHHTLMSLSAVVFCTAGLLVPASADLITVSGTISGTASVSDPPEDKPADTQQSVSLGFDAPGPKQLTLTSPSGTEDEETTIQQTFSASASGFTVGGTSDSADNLSAYATHGQMSVHVVFTVDQALLYEWSFSKNNDPGESVTAQLVGSDHATPLFAFDGLGQGGQVDLIEEFTLNPGVTYTLTASLESSAGGAGSAQSTTTYLIGLALIPEPATGLLLGLGAVLVARRRQRSA